MTKPQAIYRKDYKVSEYLIKTTELSFELFADYTIVSSKINFYKNPLTLDATGTLFLDGVDLELLEIKKNNLQLDGSAYVLSTDGIHLSDLTDEFTLEVKVRVYPHKNTSLNGLYKSSGNFCTQCEAHGFRRITYYLDRPDVLSIVTVRIYANTIDYPVLLSNGNLIEQGDNYVVWHDPHPKPCYLFALVAGKLAVLEDSYTTKSGNEVALKIYTEERNIGKTNFAMSALKRSFAWDEERFDLEYDLDIYMIVAVDDFNMGAMENKGLNVFNSSYVLANPETATDTDFMNIEAVIGHEYFHNWSGNRVTCRDWFQLSLKEGLTVFRDQEFSADLHSRAIKRIDDVITLRTFQFAEDAGPMAHPVRPESYIEMNNFYTVTVYEKGAEIIRMIHTILGEQGFQNGMKLYFKKYDGKAVTIDDFISAMSAANNFDFKPFMNWYSQAGTPTVEINSNYDEVGKIYTVDITQNSPATYYLPISYGFLNADGKEVDNGVLIVDEKHKTYTFDNIDERPIASWLRGFSAPVIMKTDLSLEDRIFLVAHDTDAFNRWDNAQNLWLEAILHPQNVNIDELFLSFKKALNDNDSALVSEMFSLPFERFIHTQVKQIDVVDIRAKKDALISKIVCYFANTLMSIYNKLNNNSKYQFNATDVGNRALKNLCLFYLTKGGNFDLAYQQFNDANCMSDKLSAFNALLSADNPYKEQVIAAFFDVYKNDTQVMDKWFRAQALSPSTTVDDIEILMRHELFNFTTPNRLLAVIASFSQNFVQFHNAQGYELLTGIIIKLNTVNPQIGARLTRTYNNWRRYTQDLSKLQQQQLQNILATKNLSNDIFEVCSLALK